MTFKSDRPGKKKLVIISAPSGAGKSTIVQHLLKSGLHLEFSVSATTRQPRGKEVNGVEYYFLDVDEFKRLISEDKFVEWQEVYKDLYYGTLKSELTRIWESGHHVLFDVDVMGGVNLKNIFGEDAISVFIMPPSVEELGKRLRNRGTDSEEKICVRVEKAKEELKLAERFDYIVVNDNIDEARAESSRIISDFLNN